MRLMLSGHGNETPNVYTENSNSNMDCSVIWIVCCLIEESKVFSDLFGIVFGFFDLWFVMSAGCVWKRHGKSKKKSASDFL